MTIDYGGETTAQPPAVEPSEVDGAPREPDIVIDDLVVLRGRINGYGEHRHDIPADAASEYVRRLFDLMLDVEPSMYSGILNQEPFLVWAGSDGEELVKAATGFALLVVGDPSLGIDGPLRDFYWAQVGIASLFSGVGADQRCSSTRSLSASALSFRRVAGEFAAVEGFSAGRDLAHRTLLRTTGLIDPCYLRRRYVPSDRLATRSTTTSRAVSSTR